MKKYVVLENSNSELHNIFYTTNSKRCEYNQNGEKIYNILLETDDKEEAHRFTIRDMQGIGTWYEDTSSDIDFDKLKDRIKDNLIIFTDIIRKI